MPVVIRILQEQTARLETLNCARVAIPWAISSRVSHSNLVVEADRRRMIRNDSVKVDRRKMNRNDNVKVNNRRIRIGSSTAKVQKRISKGIVNAVMTGRHHKKKMTGER